MDKAKRGAVAGVTGSVGRHVVELVETAEHQVEPTSGTHGVDVITSAGLEADLSSVERVAEAADPPSPKRLSRRRLASQPP